MGTEEKERSEKTKSECKSIAKRQFHDVFHEK